MIDSFLLNYSLYALLLIMGISLYGVISKPHLTKKIISLTIFGDTINLFAIFIGYRLNSTPPELDAPYEVAHNVISRSVDPLPQALVLTAIVIGLAITLFLIFLSLQVHRLYGTLDMRKVRELRE